MSELNAVVAGLQITVLMLAASALVFIHLKMYFDWKSFKAREKAYDEFFEKGKDDIRKDINGHEA